MSTSHWRAPTTTWTRELLNEHGTVRYHLGRRGGLYRIMYRARPGRWKCINSKDEYDKQPDGWFVIQEGQFFALRDADAERALDEIEADLDRHINRLILSEE